MNENIQNTTQSNVENFKKVYSETLAECIERRKVSGMTQKGLAEWFNVDVRKIIELEKGNGGVGQAFKSVLFRPLDEVLSEISIEELTHQLVEKC